MSTDLERLLVVSRAGRGDPSGLFVVVSHDCAGGICVQRLPDARNRSDAVEGISLTGEHRRQCRLDLVKMCLELFFLSLLHRRQPPRYVYAALSYVQYD